MRLGDCVDVLISKVDVASQCGKGVPHAKTGFGLHRGCEDFADFSLGAAPNSNCSHPQRLVYIVWTIAYGQHRHRFTS